MDAQTDTMRDYLQVTDMCDHDNPWILKSTDVIRIYQNLSANSIQVWLTGVWGIDALLQEQTRPH